MNILELIRRRIVSNFPDITEEELEIRLNYARQLLEGI